VPAVEWAIHTALDFFKDEEGWIQLMRNGMAQDFSWDRQAGEYLKLYRDLSGKSD
jgi:starch synthase